MKRPIHIIFTNGKGGTGKTTTCFLAALAFAHDGKRVGYLDTDWQKTLTKALAMRAADEPKITPYLNNPEDHDVVVVDSPPRLDERPFIRALSEADLMVVVTEPSLPDLWSTQQSVIELQRIAPGKRAVLLINGDQPGRVLSREFPALLAQANIGLPLVKSGGRTFSFHHRECYKHAFAGGWNALDDAGSLGASMMARALFDAATQPVKLPATPPATTSASAA